MAPNPEPSYHPKQIGRYRITGELGRGGMGVVLEGEDPRLGRRVAVKLLPANLVADPEARARFEREARAASALDHPAICTIYEIADTDDGQAYIVMAHYEGRTLKDRIADGPVPVDEVVRIARSIADGLSRAHEQNIVHRDIKPGNVIVTPRRDVKILDFGVAKLAGEAGLTDTGISVGTLRYMAPEQASGGAVDGRADLWALGVLIYEMLTGTTPFERATPAATMGAILSVDSPPVEGLRPDTPPELSRLVSRLLARDPSERPGTAAEVASLLAPLDPTSTGMSGAQTSVGGGSASRKRRWWSAAGAAGVLLAGGGWWWVVQGSEARWARQEAIPEVIRLAGENRVTEAATLALRVEAVLGDDPLLQPLWGRISSPLRIRTEPSGATVRWRPYSDDSVAWTDLGTTPIDLDRMPLGAARFLLELDGHEPVEVVRSFLSAHQQTELAHAGYDYQDDASYAIDVRLSPAGQLPDGMIRVAGGVYGTVPLLGFTQLSPRMIPEYHIDRTEVTNAAFAEFVQDGGYDEARWWSAALEGTGVSPAEAIARFVDATGRRGPATWQLGAPPDGLDDHPVTGVSWFEATAYCAWRGAALPTLYHWARAALPSAGAWVPFSPTLAARSNLNSDGTLPVGSLRATGISGAEDLLGNAREWTSTASGTARYLLGSSWADPAYTASDANALPPWRRADGDGFRCARYGPEEPPASLFEGLTFPAQEFTDRPSMSDDAFEVSQAFYAYSPTLPLATRVDSTRTHADGWRVEWVSVETPYGERMPIRLHLPTNTPPPWESVIFFPGGNLLRSPEMDQIDLIPLDFVLRAGRVLVEPVFDGGFQRNDGRTLERWSTRAGQTELMQRWVQDLGRTLDFIEEREDLVTGATSYMGMSLGAVVAPSLLPYVPRLRAAILISGGFSRVSSQQTIDRQVALARRVSMPIMMLVGNEDIVSPVEPHKRALLDAFGSPDSAKILRVYEAGHWPLPMNDVMRETADFLDRYGGG